METSRKGEPTANESREFELLLDLATMDKLARLAVQRQADVNASWLDRQAGPPETMGAEKDEIVNKQRAAAWLRERDEHRRGREEWRVNCEDSILQTLMRSVLLKKPKEGKEKEHVLNSISLSMFNDQVADIDDFLSVVQRFFRKVVFDSVLRQKKEAYSLILQSVERSRVSFADALVVPLHLANEDGEWAIPVENQSESLKQRMEFGSFLESLVRGQKRRKRTPEKRDIARSSSPRAASPTSMFRAVSPSKAQSESPGRSAGAIVGAGELMSKLLLLKRNHKATILQKCARRWIARVRARKWREQKLAEMDAELQQALKESVLVIQAFAKTKYERKFVQMREWKKRTTKLRRKWAAKRIQRWWRVRQYWIRAIRMWKKRRKKQKKVERELVVSRYQQLQKSIALRKRVLSEGGEDAKQYLLKWFAAVKIQSAVRRYLSGLRASKRKNAIIGCQALLRGRIARRAFRFGIRMAHFFNRRLVRTEFEGESKDLIVGHDEERELVLTHVYTLQELRKIDKEIRQEQANHEKSFKEWEKTFIKTFNQRNHLGEQWIEQLDFFTNKVQYYNVHTGDIQQTHPFTNQIKKKVKEQRQNAQQELQQRLDVLEQYRRKLIEMDRPYFVT